MPTIRPNSPYLDSILGQDIPLLDHGYIRVEDYMGTDACVVKAARMSNGKGTRPVNDDINLINYLTEHWHSSVFEMCELKLRIKAPLMVARQWDRHRTAHWHNKNEMSGRYSEMDTDFYTPAAHEICAQSKSNKQGRGEPLEQVDAERVSDMIERHSKISRDVYQSLMVENAIAKEICRSILPLNFYTIWEWKLDLNNLFNFIFLRYDPHAQLEIRKYADAIWQIVQQWVPISAAAFDEFRLQAMSLSHTEQEAVRMLFAGQQPHKDMLKARQWEKLERLLVGV